VTDDAVLRGELHDELVGALHRLPELVGRDLTLTALSGGITNRNFRVDASGTDERWVIRLAGNDTHLLGISREVEHAATVAAAGVGVGPEVTAFIRPEGYLVTRFIVGEPVSAEAVHRPETLRRVADSLRRIDDGHRIRIIDWEYAGMGDPFFDLGNFSINHELEPEEDELLLTVYDGSIEPRRLARLTLMRVVSDFREAMWGVLQQGVSTLDVDFVAYAAGSFDRLLHNAATPRFEQALAQVAEA